MVKLRLEIEFEMRRMWASRGDAVSSVADIPQARSWNKTNLPIIPATSVKGVLREALERALCDCCAGPAPEHYRCSPSEPCIVCRHFGNPKITARLRFSNAKPNQTEPSLQNRYGVGVSRWRRAALEEVLFTREVVEHKTLVCEVSGYYEGWREALEGAALLGLACRLLVAIGAAKTRGLGFVVKAALRNVAIDGKPVADDQINAEIERIWKEKRCSSSG
ncbi:MAG: hypothetical protein DRP82_01765 [Planctomycetota bacterium]|nr:MAG: hypothetical protein DRP82_01765 [Planctomycetota bacterium]